MDYSQSDLEYWDSKICDLADEFGLDYYPVDYEIVDYYSMIGTMAYHGLPTHYDHWSFGKSFERTHQMYNEGMEGLPFELIINSNPSIAYLMRDNPLYLQILIMAHCLGHSDFFKKNRMFAHTKPETIIQRFRAAKKRIQSYMEDPHIGIDQVEKALDACHAIQFQMSKSGRVRKTRQEQIEEYTSLINEDKTGRYKKIDLSKNPIEPDYDLLAFISENARLPSWKKDIIDICIDEGQYFIPQMQTKVANEGWASFIHYTLCHKLNLKDEFHLPILKVHNQVVRPHIGSINPYHLGFYLFQKIEERFGLQECFIAREACNDISFVRQYLEEKDCFELNLFTYGKRLNGDVIIDQISDNAGWEEVKNQLLQQIGGSSVPVIKIMEIKKDGTLIMDHEHTGKDLDMSYAKKVVGHIKDLWESEVKLNCKISHNSYEI
jgi:stage V sporulation protein R